MVWLPSVDEYKKDEFSKLAKKWAFEDGDTVFVR
jgi:hypothetical protein